MDDKIIPFPAAKKKADPTSESGVSDRQLERLREAFDLAREDWPLEMGELPEKNRVQSSKK